MRDERARPWAARAWPWGVAGLLLWLVRYGAFAKFGGGAVPWASWFDQGRYLQSAAAFAHLDLSPARHWYPLAYPLLAGPFVRILPRDPFMIVDAGLFVAALFGFQRAMKAVGVDRLWSGIAFLASALAQGKVAQFWIDPWTTSLSAPLIWWALALAAELIVAAESEIDRKHLAALGLAIGLLPTARPADLLVSIIIGLCTLIVLAVRRRLSPIALAWLAGAAALPVLVYLGLHLAIYGPYPTPYMLASARTGFVFGDLPWKAYVLLVTARPWFPGALSLVEKMPWLPLGCAGILALLPTLRGRRGQAWGLILGTAFAYILLMLCYTDLQPPGLWQFNNAHYFKWLYPLLAVGVVLLVQGLRTPGRRWPVVAGLGLTAAACCIRIVPQPVAQDVPARMLFFRGDARADWNGGYFAPAMLTDRLGAMENVRDFHQVPDGDRIRALAIRRLIGGDAVLSQPDGHAEVATARYGERVSFGMPCWFRRSACAIR